MQKEFVPFYFSPTVDGVARVRQTVPVTATVPGHRPTSCSTCRTRWLVTTGTPYTFNIAGRQVHSCDTVEVAFHEGFGGKFFFQASAATTSGATSCGRPTSRLRRRPAPLSSTDPIRRVSATDLGEPPHAPNRQKS